MRVETIIRNALRLISVIDPTADQIAYALAMLGRR
jgi:hypothetical protein